MSEIVRNANGLTFYEWYVMAGYTPLNVPTRFRDYWRCGLDPSSYSPGMNAAQWHALADERAAELVRLRDVASDLVSAIERGHVTNDYLRALAALREALEPK
jgi:hypothetical protein